MKESKTSPVAEQLPEESEHVNPSLVEQQNASIALRILAVVIDLTLVTIALAIFSLFYLGFDDSVRNYLQNANDLDARKEFLANRNLIRDASLVFYLLYALILEASPLSATIGQLTVGLRATDKFGVPGIGPSIARGIAKFISAIPCGLGFWWALVSPQHLTWHDMLSGTRVIDSENVRRRRED